MKNNNIELGICIFCASNNLEIIANVSFKDDMQINSWYITCKDCSARGGEMQSQNDAIAMWNRTQQYLDVEQQEPTSFDMDYIAINDDDKSETYTFKATSDEDAKHWIINNLNTGKSWTFYKQ